MVDCAQHGGTVHGRLGGVELATGRGDVLLVSAHGGVGGGGVWGRVGVCALDAEAAEWRLVVHCGSCVG